MGCRGKLRLDCYLYTNTVSGTVGVCQNLGTNEAYLGGHCRDWLIMKRTGFRLGDDVPAKSMVDIFSQVGIEHMLVDTKDLYLYPGVMA